jgi:cobyrinic acid a,c-diamide synthase
MPQAMIETLIDHAGDADLVLAEGAMGLFDGAAAEGASGTGASAEIAALTGWPVLIVLDPAGQAQTAAAVAAGLAAFEPSVRIAGVVLNRVASPRHEALVRKGMERGGVTVFGALPRHSPIALPDRHLGLVQAEETAHLTELLDIAAALVAEKIDLDALFRAAAGKVDRPKPAVLTRIRPPGQRIALARDAAHSFIYPHLLEAWRAAGTEILPFSPLSDEAPDKTADVCWLPGGYPELHAGRLSAASRFRSSLKAFAETRPVHGECGGYMVMGTGLVDSDGARHEMTGVLGLETSFAARRMHLGYRLARLEAPIPGYARGTRLRGHEFHYATVLSQPDAPLAAVSDANGAAVAESGSRKGQATGSFFHFIAEDQ